MEIQFFDIGFERFKVAMIIGQKTGIKHDQIPGTPPVGKLQQRFGHKGFARDDLNFQLDAMFVQEFLLKKAHAVLEKLAIDNHFDRGALIGFGGLCQATPKAAKAHAQVPVKALPRL